MLVRKKKNGIGIIAIETADGFNKLAADTNAEGLGWSFRHAFKSLASTAAAGAANAAVPGSANIIKAAGGSGSKKKACGFFQKLHKLIGGHPPCA